MGGGKGGEKVFSGRSLWLGLVPALSSLFVFTVGRIFFTKWLLLSPLMGMMRMSAWMKMFLQVGISPLLLLYFRSYGPKSIYSYYC